jgi:hypothetical protein
MKKSMKEGERVKIKRGEREEKKKLRYTRMREKKELLLE